MRQPGGNPRNIFILTSSIPRLCMPASSYRKTHTCLHLLSSLQQHCLLPHATSSVTRVALFTKWKQQPKQLPSRATLSICALETQLRNPTHKVGTQPHLAVSAQLWFPATGAVPTLQPRTHTYQEPAWKRHTLNQRGNNS